MTSAKLTMKQGKGPVKMAYRRNMAGACLAEQELSLFPQTGPSLGPEGAAYAMQGGL